MPNFGDSLDNSAPPDLPKSKLVQAAPGPRRSARLRQSNVNSLIRKSAEELNAPSFDDVDDKRDGEAENDPSSIISLGTCTRPIEVLSDSDDDGGSGTDDESWSRASSSKDSSPSPAATHRRSIFRPVLATLERDNDTRLSISSSGSSSSEELLSFVVFGRKGQGHSTVIETRSEFAENVAVEEEIATIAAVAEATPEITKKEMNGTSIGVDEDDEANNNNNNNADNETWIQEEQSNTEENEASHHGHISSLLIPSSLDMDEEYVGASPEIASSSLHDIQIPLATHSANADAGATFVPSSPETSPNTVATASGRNNQKSNATPLALEQTDVVANESHKVVDDGASPVTDPLSLENNPVEVNPHSAGGDAGIKSLVPSAVVEASPDSSSNTAATTSSVNSSCTLELTDIVGNKSHEVLDDRAYPKAVPCNPVKVNPHSAGGDVGTVSLVPSAVVESSPDTSPNTAATSWKSSPTFAMTASESGSRNSSDDLFALEQTRKGFRSQPGDGTSLETDRGMVLPRRLLNLPRITNTLTQSPPDLSHATLLNRHILRQIHSAILESELHIEHIRIDEVNMREDGRNLIILHPLMRRELEWVVVLGSPRVDNYGYTHFESFEGSHFDEIDAQPRLNLMSLICKWCRL